MSNIYNIPHAPFTDSTIGIVSTNGVPLNLRSGPLITSSVISTIPSSSSVKIIRPMDDFYYVNYNGLRGYAAKKFIDLSRPLKAESIKTMKTCRYNNNTCNRFIATNSTQKSAAPIKSSTSTIRRFRTQSIIGDTGTIVNSVAPGQSAIPITPVVSYPIPATGIVRTQDEYGVLNLREGPWVTSPVITTIPNKAYITVFGQYGDFYQVEYNRVDGFVAMSYIEIIQK